MAIANSTRAVPNTSNPNPSSSSIYYSVAEIMTSGLLNCWHKTLCCSFFLRPNIKPMPPSLNKLKGHFKLRYELRTKYGLSTNALTGTAKKGSSIKEIVDNYLDISQVWGALSVTFTLKSSNLSAKSQNTPPPAQSFS